MTAEFVVGRYDWVKNRGGRGNNDPQRLARLGKSSSSRAMRAAGNIRGVPQVVFKVVAGGGCKGPKGLSAQMDYILGKADQIIDPTKRFDRESRLHSSYSEAMAKRWSDRWQDRSENGHTMHMVASFPRGTDPEKIAEITRDACYEILDQGRSRFRYIAAVHTDKEHPHAHIIVDRKNAEGEWFYFARGGEFTYDRFKDSLVEHAATYGVELVNTSKLSRGITDDADRSAYGAKRGLAGTLIEHGAAPYQQKRHERMSYYVTVETSHGQKTLWGKELQGAICASGAVAGDAISVTHEGKEAVQVETRDGKQIKTHRNRWAVELPGREASRAGAAEAGPAIGPTEAEQKTAEWKRAQVLTHAAQYRSLAATYKSAFPALSSGFSTAADLLEEGSPLTPKALADRSKTMATDAELQTEQDAARVTIERASDYLASVRETIPELETDRRPEVEARYFDAVRDVDELSSGVAAAEYAQPAHGTLYAEDQRHAIAALDRDQLAEAVKGTGLDADELRARAEVAAPSAAVEEYWLEQDAQAIADARGYDMASEEGRAAAYGDLAEVHMSVYAAAEARRDQDLDAATAEAEQRNRDEQELRANSREVMLPVITGADERLEMTAAQVKEAAARDPGLYLEGPDFEKIPPTEEAIGAYRDHLEEQRRLDEIDYDSLGDPDYLGRLAEAQFNRNAVENRIEKYSVYLSRTGEAQEFSTAREAGVAFADADAKDLPSATERIGRSTRHMAGTVLVGNERAKAAPSMESIDADPSSRESDREFWEGYHERTAMLHRDNRDLVSTLEEREELISEAKELAERENPTILEQRRLTAIVERVAGPDAAQQLREGKTEALSKVIPDQAERFDMAESYLKAEQAQGRDRADAIEAVQKDREAAELGSQAVEKREEERGDTERARARDRDSGHDL